MHHVRGLTSYGRLFLLTYSEETGVGRHQAGGGQSKGIGSNQAKNRGDERTGKKKRRGGKPPLEKSNPLLFQVYQRIQNEHRPHEEYAEMVKRLKDDKDFMQQITEVNLKLKTKLKLNIKLVRRALAFFDYRSRSSKNQENGSS